MAAEENDKREWINWRLTKSDGLTYGDLDARFLERPLEPSDVVDDVAVNPTTHISRRGAFLRKELGNNQTGPSGAAGHGVCLAIEAALVILKFGIDDGFLLRWNV